MLGWERGRVRSQGIPDYDHRGRGRISGAADMIGVEHS